jgi:hypothetical protein
LEETTYVGAAQREHTAIGKHDVSCVRHVAGP